MVSDDKLKLLLKHITAPKQQQGVDNRGIIGAMLTALGVNQARVVPDAIKRLQFEKADALKNWSGGLPKPDQFKPFDVMLRTGSGTGELEPAWFDWSRAADPDARDSTGSKLYRTLYETVAGKRDGHAYVLLPYDRMVDGKKVTDLVPVVIGQNTKGAVVPVHKDLIAGKKTLDTLLGRLNSATDPFIRGRISRAIKLIRSAPDVYSSKRQALERSHEFGAKNYRDLQHLIEENWGFDPVTPAGPPKGIHELLRDKESGPGTYRFLRLNQELSPAERSEAVSRIIQAQKGSFLTEDNDIAAAKNFLFGPGKAKSQFTSSPIPTCSGGVCHVFEGMRDMPSPERALPQDLAKHPSFTEVGNFFRGKAPDHLSGNVRWSPPNAAGESEYFVRQSQRAISNNSIRAARRALALRTGMAALPLGVGGYMLGSSPTFQNMVQPLAEQGQLIGNQVKDLVNQARRYNRSTTHQAL